MLCSIYKMLNQINGKIYVGQTWRTIQKRFGIHKQPSYKGCINLHNALNKYGRDKFTIELITICGTQDAADYWERFFILKYNSIDNGYNLRNGGHGDYDVLRDKISASLKGRPSPLRGRSQSKEMVLKRVSKNAAMQKGVKKSAEQVAKLAARLTGRKQTSEHIANMKAAQLAAAYKHSEETLAKMRGPKAISKEQLTELLHDNLTEKEALSKYGISRTTFYTYKRVAHDISTIESQ